MRYTGSPAELEKYTATHTADMRALIAAHTGMKTEVEVTAEPAQTEGQQGFEWPESPIGKPGDGFPETKPWNVSR